MNAFVESIETQSSAKQFFVSKVLVEGAGTRNRTVPGRENDVALVRIRS